MRIVLVSNISNGIGLQKDCQLLGAFLGSLGHEVSLQQFNLPIATKKADLCILLETISEETVKIAPRNWYFANPEWLTPDKIRLVKKHCEIVFAKTKEAYGALQSEFLNVQYVGFLTEDKGDSKMKRERKFLHIGGNGGHRNTNAVISAWREYRYWTKDELPELTVVSNSKTVEPIRDVPGITFIRRATDEQITELQNSHLFHLFPSGYEGFGHALHEAQSSSAILLTTDAAPMNEVAAPFKVPSIRTKLVNMGTVHEVSGRDIREQVSKMMALPNRAIAKFQNESRQWFEYGNREFKRLFPPHLDTPSRSLLSLPYFVGDEDHPITSGTFFGIERSPVRRKLRISFLGNFIPPHSTENDLLWTLRDLGHEVITFQENAHGERPLPADLFLWVHTHGWGDEDYFAAVLKFYKEHGIPTASFHLDLYFGLNDGDGRESKVGKHPFWKTDICMTADGSSQEKFAERGVNHVWVKPGVVARDCKSGIRREELAIDIGFCGAEGYHNEWPWRGEMIRILRNVYGDKFKVFSGFRGERLNDLYASVNILVGDCCFAGKPRYYSDRWTETCGRGGFLLAPQIEGCCIPLATFTPCNIRDLTEKIDYYLAHGEERELIRRAAHEHVKNHDTYSHRVKEILGLLNL
jgi:hypothetical protein